MVAAGTDLGTEIEFSDGKYVVDNAYVAPIHEATNGDPSGFTFKEALALMGPALGKDVLRQAQRDVISQHFGVNRPWGS